jgi:hypothetical protein
MAYNPNDCPEVRWGASDGTDERATCKRRAPSDQRRKMEKGARVVSRPQASREGLTGPQPPPQNE